MWPNIKSRKCPWWSKHSTAEHDTIEMLSICNHLWHVTIAIKVRLSTIITAEDFSDHAPRIGFAPASSFISVVPLFTVPINMPGLHLGYLSTEFWRFSISANLFASLGIQNMLFLYKSQNVPSVFPPKIIHCLLAPVVQGQRGGHAIDDTANNIEENATPEVIIE